MKNGVKFSIDRFTNFFTDDTKFKVRSVFNRTVDYPAESKKVFWMFYHGNFSVMDWEAVPGTKIYLVDLG